MKRLRWAYLAILLVYAGILIVVQFHTHSAGPDQLTAHCKFCQVSQTVYDSVQSKDLRIAQPILHYQELETQTLPVYEFQEIPPGRAPPQI